MQSKVKGYPCVRFVCSNLASIEYGWPEHEGDGEAVQLSNGSENGHLEDILMRSKQIGQVGAEKDNSCSEKELLES